MEEALKVCAKAKEDVVALEERIARGKGEMAGLEEALETTGKDNSKDAKGLRDEEMADIEN